MTDLLETDRLNYITWENTRMKKYELGKRLAFEDGETVLGAKDLGTHNCYLIYGEIKPSDEPRLLKPGRGHEEIICVVSGEMTVSTDEGGEIVRAGEAFYLKDEESLVATASTLCVYVAAGGHTAEGGHHH